MKKMIITGLMMLSFLTFYIVYADDQPTPDDIVRESSASTLLSSNLFTHVDDLTPYEQDLVDMSEYQEVLDNGALTLFVHEENLTLRILNQSTGFIWSTNLVEIDDDAFNATWIRRINSPFSYTYYDRQNRLITRSLLDSRNDLSLDYTVNPANQSVVFHIDITDNEFRFDYEIGLVEDQLTFSFDTTSIEEYGTNRFASISFFEFLGAAKKDDIPGYNFIPSGNGALVRYNETSEVNAQYRAYFLGRDLYYSANPNNLALYYPVYGSVHGINQNGFFVNITEGFEHALYNYAPTGVRTDYHRQYVTYFLRESYVQNIRGADTSPTIIEPNLREYSINFNINFLSGNQANYVGMAHNYKDYLLENNFLNSQSIDSETALHLDVLGSDYEEGLIFKNHHPMTTTDDILGMHQDLMNGGINHILYTLRGFNQGGYTDHAFDNYDFNGRLGDIEDLSDLDLYMLYDPVTLMRLTNQAPRSAMQMINNTYARRTHYDGDYYEYFANIDSVLNRFDRAYNDLTAYGGMALDGLSYQFYSNRDYSRTEMIDKYLDLINDPVPMVRPNSLMLYGTSEYLNIPFQHERLRFFTDNVPFLQIVLSGEIPYYSRHLNFSANRQIDLLKAIDFGANPAYLVTQEPSHLLSRTSSRGFYGTHYENLEIQIIDDYHFINQALREVNGHAIVNREVLREGLVKVTYSNDVSIYINYRAEAIEVDGHLIDALNYLVRK